MSFSGRMKKRKYEKKKRQVKKELSMHLFSVTSSEQNSPTHRKLRKNPSRREVEEYLDYRMNLRRKWIDKFFEFHTDIDPKIMEEVRKEAYEDIELFKRNLLEEMGYKSA
jgi:hypothetical protein